MFAVVVAANLLTRIERTRRREAVEAERAAQEERDRIARDIHDGIAQSIYALSLGLETCADLAEEKHSPLRDQLHTLVPIAKKTLLETRHYIQDLKPLLDGQSDVVAIAHNQVKEFRMVTGTPIQLSIDGEPQQVSVPVATGLHRILQEALANVLKHASASEVNVALAFEPGKVRLSVKDDGVGFRMDGASPGYGLANMRQRAEELGGSFQISSVPGEGTTIGVTLPIGDGADSGGGT